MSKSPFHISMLTATIATLVGCAGVSGLTVDQVRQLSNADLCYLNSTTPVGFVPLELDRRTRDQDAPLDCKNHEQEILERLAKQSGETILGRVNVPSELLNQADCKGVLLGQTLSSFRREVLGGSSTITTSGYYREVHNNRSAATFVHFEILGTGSSTTTRLIKLPARGKQIIRFGAQGSSPNVTISNCRSF